MATVNITRDVLTGDARINFRYDPVVVELIKTLPSWGRRWNPALKEWTVFEAFVPVLTTILEADGHRVLSSFTRSTPPPRPRSAPVENWADALLDAVGPERVEPVHRALTRVLHPDTGTGDTALMQALNVARDRRMVGGRAA